MDSTLPPNITLHDALIIGAGPGGLTAAIYLRRFMRDVQVIDSGASRMALIPLSHNYPGFCDGVPGQTLLDNLRRQLQRYGGTVRQGEVTSLVRQDDHFVAGFDGGAVAARRVILATGTADLGVPVENWRAAVASGAMRLCPVCDGYDVLDKRIAVVSAEHNRIAHALFMRTFSPSVTLFERAPCLPLSEQERCALAAAGVRFIASALVEVALSEDLKPVLHTADGERHTFDVLYPMLGERARSALATGLGARCGDCGELATDNHQQTSVAGLYAVGDVVQGLNQISVATGQAAVAATAIHNALARALRGA